VVTHPATPPAPNRPDMTTQHALRDGHHDPGVDNRITCGEPRPALHAKTSPCHQSGTPDLLPRSAKSGSDAGVAAKGVTRQRAPR
jgi:hypothetical protein